ncbi:MAG TPA: 16S rRNA (cytosine(1402)-N(4))-methyltransferase RsmH [Acidimicrobiales bacterium]|nr:16S rRNA (cytosine(1402)-N(4))-methyltransferase RsmH [Acidimicrobiales bacterium]
MEDPYSARFHLSQPGRHPGGALPVEGLQMDQDFAHRAVMVDEVVSLFAPVPPGFVIDCTVGAGGHAEALLDAHPHLCVLGLDQDEDAAAAAGARLARFGPRARLVRARFDRLAEAAADSGAGPVTGVLFDLGVSSPQLDRPERGFSYRQPGPLDMRMDRSAALTADEVVNSYPVDQLATVLAAGGEERLAGRIARAVVAARPITDTRHLAEVVAAAVAARGRRRGHPARRVFQAVRIEVNQELAVLDAALDAVPGVLVPGGRCCVISYHSGEDRKVKARFAHWATGGCTCPPGLPCGCGAVPAARLLNRGARKPSAAEVAANPRADSARFRAVEWLEAA